MPLRTQESCFVGYFHTESFILKEGMHALKGEKRRILVVDDEEPIRTLIAEFLRDRGFESSSAGDGSAALEQLSLHRFDLVLSDIRMPGMDGMALLNEISRDHSDVSVVMLTGCEDVSVAVKAMKAGALDYILKPFRLDDVAASVTKALEQRDESLRKVRRVRELEQVVEQQSVELRKLLDHLHEASEDTLEALVAALDAREHETLAHSKRVSEYTVHLAREMGVEEDPLEVIRRGAMLHDIGKIGISDNILLKPARLTESEWKEMRRHPEIGFWILNGIDSLRPAAGIVLSHHERFDGSGYPQGLKGTAIPLGARIFAVADSLDAMTSDRPYHKGESYDAAKREIAGNAGTQFDPEVVNRFLHVPPDVWEQIRQRSLRETPRKVPDIASLVPI